MTYATLDEWLDEIETFGARRDRLYEAFDEEAPAVITWLETAWRLGGEAGRARIEKLETELAAANALIAAMTPPVTEADIAEATAEAKRIRPLIDAEEKKR